jgi:hypothetical protein
MAFVMDDIQVISPGIPKLFLYRTNDANAVYEAAGYFSTVPGMAAGDIIIVAGDLDGTPEGSILTVTGAGVTTTTDAQTNT